MEQRRESALDFRRFIREDTVLQPTTIRRDRTCRSSRAQARRARKADPDRPIRILVGYPAGGGVDLVARMLGEPMKAAFSQTVLVENRAGASAMIAANAVAKAAPDGTMLLMAASGEVAINQHLHKDKMTYDPLRELGAVALVGIVPCVVVVAATTPVKNAAELIAYARANRGKLSFSSSGIGNPQQLAGELMNHMAGIDVLHVPYRGSAPAVTDVATGAVTMSFSSLAAALPLMQDGRLRAVAVTSRERMPQLPDVPTLAEAGPELKDYELLNWFGLFAPAGTPEPIVTRLNEVVNAGLRDKAIADKLEVQGIVPRIDDGAAVSRLRGRGGREVRQDRRAGQHQAAELMRRRPHIGLSHADHPWHCGPAAARAGLRSAALDPARAQAARRRPAGPAGHRRGACAPSARRGRPAVRARSRRPTSAITTIRRRGRCACCRSIMTGARSRRWRSPRMRSRTRCSTRAASPRSRAASSW